MRKLIVLLATGLALAPLAFADTPELSDVPEVLVSPNGSLTYVVTVRGLNGPVPDIPIELRFSPEMSALLCWCAGQEQTTLTAISDAQGLASFIIQGGGCVEPVLSPNPRHVKVYAVSGGDILLAEVGVVSPDAVDSQGRTPLMGWDPQGQCAVGLADATFHTGPIASGTFSYCSDLDSNNSVDLVDAVLITGPVTVGASCPQ